MENSVNKNVLPPAELYREYLMAICIRLNIQEPTARKRYGQHTIEGWEELFKITAPQTPTKPSGMEGEFLNAVETLAANLKTRLLREAVKEWEQHRRNTEITPVMAQKLAADMVRRELAMEVYYSLSTKP